MHLFGKNLLLDDSLVPTYKNLLGIEVEKPLDCVGEIAESRAAMSLIQQMKEYNSIATQYASETPAGYDFTKRRADAIPEDIKKHNDQFNRAT